MSLAKAIIETAASMRRRGKTKAAHPDWPKAHAHADAMRIMTKALIADLWAAWRQK